MDFGDPRPYYTTDKDGEGEMASIAAEDVRQVNATVNYVASTDEPLYNYYFVPPPPGRSPSSEVQEPTRWSSKT